VHFDRGRLELEEAREDRVVVAAHGNEPVELLHLDGEIAERRDERAARLERRADVARELHDVVLRRQVQQRVDHADDELGAMRCVAAELAEVAADDVDLLAALVRLELREQFRVEVDRSDLEAGARERNRLEAAARAQIDRALAAARDDIARSKKLRVARERSIPSAVHPRVDVGEYVSIVLFDGRHDDPQST
jgi:hypothetical protein